MKLTGAQVAQFHDHGFLILPALFSDEEVAVLRRAKEAVFAEDTEANIREKKSGEVRTAMGLQLRHPVFDRLSHHPRLVEPAQQLLGPALYIQQTKINVKAGG